MVNRPVVGRFNCEREELMAGTNQGAPRSAASIVALVLGIIAILMSWMPIINNFAFIFGALGFIFGVVGLVGVLRGKKVGKALAIVALVINVLSIAIVLGTQSMYSAALDDAVNGPSATGTSQAEGAGEDEGGTSEEGAGYTDLAVGTTVELENGLAVTVDSVEPGLTNYDGTAVIGVHVTYVNNGDETADYNPYDWKGENAEGAQEYSTYYSEAAENFNAGTLAAGGTVSGTIYFEGDAVKVLYYGSMISDEPTASWMLA